MSGSFRTLVHILLALGGAMLTLPSAAQGQYVPVYGGPTYDEATGTGFRGEEGQVGYWDHYCCGVTNGGTAVGYALKYVGGIWNGSRAVRWDAGGTAATELGNLGTENIFGCTQSQPCALNDAGTVVGYALKYVGGIDKGCRAVRWDAGGTAATELGNLGTDADGVTSAWASALNDAGTAVGYAYKYVGGMDKGERAVRWDAGGTAATELGNLGTDADGFAYASASAVNDAGTAWGRSEKYVGGTSKGYPAVRWDAGGTAATELGNLGTDADGLIRQTIVQGVNAAGTAVGSAFKYVDGICKGQRAVRWDAGGTAATELASLGIKADAWAFADAYAVNDAGTAWGRSVKYVGGIDNGVRAVRWDAGGTSATELGNLGTDAYGYTGAEAWAVNDAGTAVGFAWKWVDGSHVDVRAVLWGADGAALDLNTLIDPASGWTLTYAEAISENGLWIGGMGEFDPDGAGPLAAYPRLWVMQSSHSGDASRDNHVNVDDLGILASHYDTIGGAVWETGDFTGDGIVNVDDLGILASNYDWVGPGGLSVPEPATLSLLALGYVLSLSKGGLAVIRRRRRAA